MTTTPPEVAIPAIPARRWPDSWARVLRGRRALVGWAAALPARARRSAGAAVAWLLARPLRLASIPAAVLCLAFSVAGASGAAGRRQPAQSAAAVAPLFQGSQIPGRMGAEASAVELVQRLGGIPLGQPSPAEPLLDPLMAAAGVCPSSRLRVSWSPPVGTYRVGAYVDPLGPPPTLDTRRVNGVVLCEGSTFSYVGFEASYGTRWLLNAVPASSEAPNRVRSPLEDLASAATPALPANPNPTVAVGPGTFVSPDLGWGAAIEPLAPYDPQAVCDPTPKPGAVGFRNLLLRSFPGSRDLGIGQDCDTPDGVSEHKEGRAFDWGVSIDNPAEAAMADRLVTWLLAPDSHGNAFAMVRRLGIMYMIWNRQIWGSYRAEDGWRPYEGVSPHTDHIHISFSWAGALAQTSFWTGHVGDLSALAPRGATAAGPAQGGRPGSSGSPPSSGPLPSRSGAAGTPSASASPVGPPGTSPSSPPSSPPPS
ncbi:MAG TPA: hypothetical protein VKI20_09120, partial [Acidimicrobiales bacterium]|nr:hypothetical protein [Acidimicrobiales bacterium]